MFYFKHTPSILVASFSSFVPYGTYVYDDYTREILKFMKMQYIYLVINGQVYTTKA